MLNDGAISYKKMCKHNSLFGHIVSLPCINVPNTEKSPAVRPKETFLMQ